MSHTEFMVPVGWDRCLQISLAVELETLLVFGDAIDWAFLIPGLDNLRLGDLFRRLEGGRCCLGVLRS